MSTALARVLDCLPDHKRHGSRYAAKCPVHQGAHRDSLSITERANGKVLLHCFAQCETAAVVRALGLAWSDLFETPLAAQPRSRRQRQTDSAPYVPTLHPTPATLYAASYLNAILADEIPARERDERFGCDLDVCEQLGRCSVDQGHQAAVALWQSWQPQLTHDAPALVAMVKKGVR